MQRISLRLSPNREREYRSEKSSQARQETCGDVDWWEIIQECGNNKSVIQFRPEGITREYARIKVAIVVKEDQ